uniref:Uncharacterized protein n=1 Tax=Oryza nivara TaxID=4536 RepID=A0A0E0FMQ4_ORYNI
MAARPFSSPSPCCGERWRPAGKARRRHRAAADGRGRKRKTRRWRSELGSEWPATSYGEHDGEGELVGSLTATNTAPYTSAFSTSASAATVVADVLPLLCAPPPIVGPARHRARRPPPPLDLCQPPRVAVRVDYRRHMTSNRQMERMPGRVLVADEQPSGRKG